MRRQKSKQGKLKYLKFIIKFSLPNFNKKIENNS